MTHIRRLLVLAALATPLVGFAAPADSETEWEAALARVIPSVVSIHVTGTRTFDTEDASNSQGTGFVVDADRGLILTNRHMVHSGPVVATAVFDQAVEVDLWPVYRDPVHDFGFYRYDPADLHKPVEALVLAPEAAASKREIRVVGNDAGEELSILDGTLAKLDRNAPRYGSNTYNDFNTFYYQAASNTSGGSSGSPVVDVQGRVLALNAGGNRQAASSFYLPLDRVVRALELLQAGQPVARGTLQTVFEHRPYEQAQHLGVPDDVVAAERAASPNITSLLVVDEVVPDGPADGLLEAGDVLAKVGGDWVTGFVPLEERLDSAVGEDLDLLVYRGSEPVEVTLPVGDLHAITPDEFLELSRGVVHELSYQQARNHSLPVGGAYVALAGYMLANAGVTEGSVIVAVDGVPVASLDDFQRELESKAQGARVRLRFYTVKDPRHPLETVAIMDRLWFPMQRCVRNDDAGVWDCTAAAAAPAPSEPEPVSFLPLEATDPVAARLAPSLVMVDFDIPVPSAGMRDFNFRGVGLVLDAERGLVVCDRDTVPVAAGDIEVTFGGTVRVPGELEYLHPVHNLAFVHYDPARLQGVDVRSAPLRTRPLRSGDRVWQVGLDSASQVVSGSSRVETVEALRMSPALTPRYRAYNVDAVELGSTVPSVGGVLADRRGRVLGLWASFVDQRMSDRTFHGLPSAYIKRVLTPLQEGHAVDYRGMGAELFPLPLADARDRGMSDARVVELVEHDRTRRKVLQVLRVAGGTPADALLREGDLLIELDGEPITRLGDLEQVSDRDVVDVVILRDGEEHTVALPTTALTGTGVDRMVAWAGLQLHEPHYEVALQKGIPAEGVYISWMWYGTPAAAARGNAVRPVRRIVEVDGQPTPDLDAFLSVVEGMSDRQSVRVRLMDMDNQEQVVVIRLDLRSWPTQVYELTDDGWSRTTLAGGE